MKTFKKIYDFREDKKFIKFLGDWVFSKRFSETDGQPVDGFIPGTSDWFSKIDEGQIPIYKIKGVITRVFMTGHNDWAEFEMESNGIITKWNRMGDKKKFVIGREVIVTYTKQKLVNGHVNIYKTTLEIQISNE